MLRKLPILIVAFLLVFAVFTKAEAVQALELPLTPPVTSPITSPITTPVQTVTLVGKVVYKQLGRLFSNINRIVPAKDVIVTIQNFFNPAQKYTTTTDQNGNYGYLLPAGLYEVTVHDGNHTFFVPPLRIVRITSTNKSKTANFQGLLFPNFTLK